MFSISAISNSFINKILLYKRNSSEDSNISAQVSDLEASDIVTLSGESLGFLEDLMNSTGDISSSTRISSDSSGILDAVYNSTAEETESSAASNGSLELLNVLFNSTANAPDTSAGSLYDVLLAARNEKLINNPDLVNMILAAEETGSSDSASWIPTTEDINIVSMSANEILSIIKKYKGYSGSATASASLIDTTA